MMIYGRVHGCNTKDEASFMLYSSYTLILSYTYILYLYRYTTLCIIRFYR
jgi:hypothetical protein